MSGGLIAVSIKTGPRHDQLINGCRAGNLCQRPTTGLLPGNWVPCCAVFNYKQSTIRRV